MNIYTVWLAGMTSQQIVEVVLLQQVITFSQRMIMLYGRILPVVNVSSGFKILKLPMELIGLEYGQLGHEQSRTFLTEGTGVNINITASGWAGDCTLDLPSIANGIQYC